MKNENAKVAFFEGPTKEILEDNINAWLDKKGSIEIINMLQSARGAKQILVSIWYLKEAKGIKIESRGKKTY
jgi:hypothetical protein